MGMQLSTFYGLEIGGFRRLPFGCIFPILLYFLAFVTSRYRNPETKKTPSNLKAFKIHLKFNLTGFSPKNSTSYPQTMTLNLTFMV
jgi:hypothetical protein